MTNGIVKKTSFSLNNFDLLRLFAASQVAASHTIEVLAPAWNDIFIIQLLNLFPGVPIFFFISGYLISRSYEHSRGLGNYSFNRAIRIFPALHACVLLNILLVAATGYFALAEAGYLDVLLLYVAKTTFLQFYNPEFMRGFGDGVLNGSLWTIAVELQFYLLTPIFYLLFISPARPIRSDIAVIAIALLSLIVNRLLYNNQAAYGETIVWKLVRVSFAPWLYMFLFGLLCQRHYEVLLRWLNSNVAPWLLLAYLTYAWLLHSIGEPVNNRIGPLLFFPLALTTLATAYCKPHLATKLLRKNDISYGIYIYHMPIVNQLLYFGIGGLLASFGALLTSVVLALISWFGLERPLLSRKRITLHRVESDASTTQAQQAAPLARDIP